MNKLIIYTDGGARGNPGPAAGGVVIKNDKDEVVFKVQADIPSGVQYMYPLA